MHRMNRSGVTALLIITLLLNSGCTSLDSAEPWHRIQLTSEFTENDLTDEYQWQDYLAQEDRVFRELNEKLATEDTTNGLRFASSSQFNPLLQTPNWNRTFILVPKKNARGHFDAAWLDRFPLLSAQPCIGTARTGLFGHCSARTRTWHHPFGAAGCRVGRLGSVNPPRRQRS